MSLNFIDVESNLDLPDFADSICYTYVISLGSTGDRCGIGPRSILIDSMSFSNILHFC